MSVFRAHKIALDLTEEQELYFRKAAGCSRFAYNWALAEWKRQYEAGEKPNKFELNKKFNAIKREEFPFVMEVAAKVCEAAIYDVATAFDRFFKKLGGYPKFKAKNRSTDSFLVNYRSFLPKGNSFRIEKIGTVKAFEALRFKGKINKVVASRTANRWFLSIGVEIADEDFKVKKPEESDVVGVDLGLKTLATISNGEVFENPRAYRRNLAKLAKLQRSVSKKVKGSSNYKKAQQKVAKLHAKIANIRQNNIHELTTALTTRYSDINMETLNVKGMVKNRNLALSISDASMGEIRRQMKYKAQTNEVNLTFVDQWFPSSKTCSNCGNVKKKLTLSERIFKCDCCGFEIDRDLNAAINIKNWKQ